MTKTKNEAQACAELAARYGLSGASALALYHLRRNASMRGCQGATDPRLRVINQASANALVRRGLAKRLTDTAMYVATKEEDE